MLSAHYTLLSASVTDFSFSHVASWVCFTLVGIVFGLVSLMYTCNVMYTLNVCQYLWLSFLS